MPWGQLRGWPPKGGGIRRPRLRLISQPLFEVIDGIHDSGQETRHYSLHRATGKKVSVIINYSFQALSLPYNPQAGVGLPGYRASNTCARTRALAFCATVAIHMTKHGFHQYFSNQLQLFGRGDKDLFFSGINGAHTFGSTSSASRLLDSTVSFLASGMSLTLKVSLVKNKKFTKTQVVCTVVRFMAKQPFQQSLKGHFLR